MPPLAPIRMTAEPRTAPATPPPEQGRLESPLQSVTGDPSNQQQRTFGWRE